MILGVSGPGTGKAGPWNPWNNGTGQLNRISEKARRGKPRYSEGSGPQ